MTYVKRIVSSMLLAAGVTFVFAGMSAAFGFSVLGVVATLAAIGTLLYAGGTWFGPAPRERDVVLVFDRQLRIACGAEVGTMLSAHFPASLRRDIETRCAAALRGEAAQFVCAEHGVAQGFHAAPVRAADGTILYGVLLTGVTAPSAALV